MRRPWQIWSLFCASLALVIAVMGWGSATILRLDRETEQARQRATIEEDVRLALWRLDSTVVPILARENAYPFDAFDHTSHIALGGSSSESPSPPQPPVQLHFQIDPGNRLTSPQVPLRSVPDSGYQGVRAGEPGSEELLLYRLAELVEASQPGAWFDEPELSNEKVAPGISSVIAQKLETQAAEEKAAQMRQMASEMKKRQRVTMEQQQVLNVSEFQARASKIEQNRQVFAQQVELPRGKGPEIELSPLRPIWIAEELLLVRRAGTDLGTYFQGGWINWPAFRAELLASIADIFPDADLVPPAVATSSSHGREELLGRQMASLPLVLEPGAVLPSAGSHGPPTRILVLVAWVFMVFAGGSIAILLHRSVALSERRGAFVSAVTHELRTPLTSMRMYAEMLANDMIADESAIKEYLGTLQQQSERLSHLVENVLAYSRIERGLTGGERQSLTVEELIERVGRPLEDLAKQNHQRLVVKVRENVESSVARVDVSAVERILFNLIDNAGKYGVSNETPEVQLSIAEAGDSVRFVVRDFGPGILPEVKSRLFTPFSKSAAQAAESAPGIGLGLTISRRLARQMGGDLELGEIDGPGTEFVLTLPVEGAGSS